ncbi:MAG: EAL domain-containing protein, partial [Burkholderiaceae bacterium]
MKRFNKVSSHRTQSQAYRPWWSTPTIVWRLVRALTCFALGFAACWLVNLLGLGSAVTIGNITLPGQLPYWPATGIAFGIGWLFGYGWMIPVALGVTTWAAWTTGSTMLTSVAGLTTFVGPLSALILLNRLSIWKPTENRLEIALRLLVAVVFVAAPIDAFLLASGLRIEPLAVQPRTLDILAGWWLLDALGMLLIAPCVVASVRGSVGVSGNLNKTSDPWLDFGPLVISALLVLGSLLASEVGRQPFAYTLIFFFIPVAAWSAIRSTEKTLAITLLASTSLIFIGRAIQLSAPNAGGPPYVEVSVLMFVATLVAILLHAVASDRRQAMDGLRQQARQDMSTGLLNDRGLIADLNKAIEQPSRRHYGLIGLHITNFDTLNDLCGPLAALDLEKSVAAALTRQPGQVAAARLSAGRYALLVHTESQSEVRATARDIYSTFNGQLFHTDNGVLRLQPSIGGLLIDRNAQTSSEDCLLSLAEAQTIANSVHDPRLFVEPLAQSIVDARRSQQARIELVREAIRERRFEIFAQPIVSSASQLNQLSYEVLVRLIDRDGSLIQPNDFLSLAAKSHMTSTLDRGVITKVFTWLARNPVAQGRTAKCSINLSGMTMSDGLIGSFIRDERQKSGIDPSRIVFEITESEAIRNPAAASRLVAELKSAGFGIALDDFGVGLATFEYLKRFAPDYLK